MFKCQNFDLEIDLLQPINIHIYIYIYIHIYIYIYVYIYIFKVYRNWKCVVCRRVGNQANPVGFAALLLCKQSL